MASKRYKQAVTKVDRAKAYGLDESVALLKELPKTKFDETVELSVALNVDPEKSDQSIRGTVILPNGTGRARRVIVFCKGEQEQDARKAGAEVVGSADLIEKVLGGWMEFDVAIATPEMMRDVSRLGKVLGPRGLMPNPKAGTVSADVAKAVTEIKQGKVEFKMDKMANLHVIVGKLSFPLEKLVENARSVIEAIMRARPSAVKGQFVRRMVVSSTMSPGIVIDLRPFIDQTQG